MTTISLLTPDQLSAAYTIEQRSHAFPWTEKTLLSNQGERYLNYQLSDDHQMVGFCISQITLDEATLFNLAIDPDWQRRGYGRQLLNHLMDELRLREVFTLWLEARVSNHSAIRLYEQLGFNAVSLRRGYYPCGNGREDAQIMALSL